MKSKLLIMAALCAAAFTTSAQTKKGDNLVGGSLNVFTAKAAQTGASSKQNEFTLGLNYGHFVAKNLAVGLSLNYNHSKVENQLLSNINTITIQKTYSVGPFVRYYVDISEKFKFFGQFNANIGSGENKQTNETSVVYKTTTYGASIVPSFAFFPTKKIAVELGFGLISYANSTSKSELNTFEKSKIEGFNFGFNSFNPKLGVNFHF